MTCGAAAAANVVLKTILNEGDEVIILAPYFFEYLYYIDNHGGVAVVAACDDQFQPDLAKIEAVVTEKTRAILINSPNNPSGAVYSEERLTGLAALLERKQAEHGTEIFIISDEPYRRIIFDGISFPQVLPQYDNSVVVTSHAKDLALPGERIGYIAVNPNYADKEELSAGLSFCNRTLGFVNAPALMQHIVRNLQGVSVDAGYYEKKRDYLCRHLGELGYDVFRPQGAFYLFPKAPIEDDVAFCKTLLNSNVLVVPGRGFGTSGYFRISYCVEDWVLEGAVKGFAAAIATPEG
jgi:aspartate aminotransferase